MSTYSWLCEFEERDRVRDQQNALRLHKAKIVREKLPGLWRDLQDHLRDKANAYRLRFPLNRVAGPGVNSSLCAVSKSDYPAVSLKLRCHGEDGTQISIEWWRKEDGNAEEKSESGVIAVLTDNNDNAYLSYGGLTQAEAIAEHLLGHVVCSFH
jgi:hypothetical protein